MTGEAEIALADGKRLLLRPVRPEDAPRFIDGFARLSPETVRQRFFGPIRAMSPALAERLTGVDHDRETAFVLIDPAEGSLYGVGRLVLDPGCAAAEFAVIVRDDVVGQGLGSRLVQTAIDIARARGIATLYGHVLADNERMLRLCRRFGFHLEPSAREPGVLLARRRLADGP